MTIKPTPTSYIRILLHVSTIEILWILFFPYFFLCIFQLLTFTSFHLTILNVYVLLFVYLYITSLTPSNSSVTPKSRRKLPEALCLFKPLKLNLSVLQCVYIYTHSLGFQIIFYLSLCFNRFFSKAGTI